MKTLLTLIAAVLLSASAPKPSDVYGHLTFNDEPVTVREMKATRAGGAITLVGKGTGASNAYTLTVVLKPIPTKETEVVNMSPTTHRAIIDVAPIAGGAAVRHYYTYGKLLAGIEKGVVSVMGDNLPETSAQGKAVLKQTKLEFNVKE